MTPANDNPLNPAGRLGLTSRSGLFAVIATAIVVLVVLAGLMAADSPWVTRDRRLDQMLVQRLNAIETSITAYHRTNAKLPAVLADLLNSPQTTPFGVDAGSLTTIEYTPNADNKGYQLCAMFLRASAEDSLYAAGRSWKHDSGRTCFSLQAP